MSQTESNILLPVSKKNDAGENVELECPINLTNHYFAEDPLTDDPSFVSLVKK